MNVKKLREQRGLSQQTVAGLLSLSRTTYTKYENGVHDPSLATLVDMARLFGVPVDYIAGGGFCSCPELGSRLRHSREAVGMTVEDTSAILNISLALYEDFELGRAEPTAKMLRQLAGTFRVSTDWLLGLAGDEDTLARAGADAGTPPTDPGRTARQADIYERIRGAFISGEEER